MKETIEKKWEGKKSGRRGVRCVGETTSVGVHTSAR